MSDLQTSGIQAQGDEATTVFVSGGGTVRDYVTPSSPISDDERLSGSWSAVLSGGETVYVSGSVTMTGAVQFARNTDLTITQGAVVSNIDIVPFDDRPGANADGYVTINVEAGGALISSHIGEYTDIHVYSGGQSEGNVYRGSTIRLDGGASVGDSLWGQDEYQGSFTAEPGSLLSDVTFANATVTIQMGCIIKGITVGDAAEIMIPPDCEVSGVVLLPGATFACSSPFGDPVTAPTRAEMPVTYDLEMGPEWRAVLDGSGRTYFTNGEKDVWENPPSIEPFCTLIVTSGAVISAIVCESLDIHVEAGGTLQDSYILNGQVQIEGGASLRNVYESTHVNILDSGHSTSDLWYGADGEGQASGQVMSGGIVNHPGITGNASLFSEKGAVVQDPSVGAGGYISILQVGEEPCFLAGSLLLTETGEKRVEALKPGDRLVSIEHGAKRCRIIERVVRRTAVIRPDLPDDFAGYPVRVYRDAFGPGLPHSDLLVTAEHCFLFEGRFVPVRMLVNGASIAYDRSMARYDYYHVELDRHSVILANGVETESYLDTGPRRALAQHVKGLPAGGRRARRLDWANDAAAPLTTCAAFVAPLHASLKERAVILGLAEEVRSFDVTADPGLVLKDSRGRRLPLLSTGEGEGGAYRAIFLLPEEQHSFCLYSRTFRPCDNLGPFIDDRRFLGVLVTRVILIDALGETRLDAHLKEGSLEGWHGFETIAGRWTAGQARIDVPEPSAGAERRLAIEMRVGGPYRVRSVAMARRAA